MRLVELLLLLLAVCSLCTAVSCEEDVDRRDVHRIILKPEKSKKHKKRTKPSKFRPQSISASASSEESFFEPSGHASTSTRYHSNHKYHQRNPYAHQHRDEYRDLVKPKPPRSNEDHHYLNYPEEESGYYQETASSNHHSYVPYQQNSGGQLNAIAEKLRGVDVFVDWNPIPSSPLTNDYYQQQQQQHYNQHHLHNDNFDVTASSSATIGAQTTTKRNRRKKKVRRQPDPSTTTPFLTFANPTTTPRPLQIHHTYLTQPYQSSSPVQQTLQAHQHPIRSNKNPQQHHYVNYNHNDKSHIKYEVTSNTKPKIFSPSVPANMQHHGSDAKTSFSNLSNSYEVFERAKDYNKQIKQTSFKSSLVPQPLYPQLQAFLPTASTYTISEKSTTTLKPVNLLDFGKKTIGFNAYPKKVLF